MKKLSFAVLVVVGATILGGTVLREPIAYAAQNLSTTIVGPLDGDGNVKVHEQGTADVNVTNSNLSVAPPAPVTGGGGGTSTCPVCAAGHFTDIQVATALAIKMDANVESVALELYEPNHDPVVSAFFVGPREGGNDTVELSLPRPIKFNRFLVFSDNDTAGASLSWVGAET
jgi:hypothetical protein